MFRRWWCWWWWRIRRKRQRRRQRWSCKGRGGCGGVGGG